MIVGHFWRISPILTHDHEAANMANGGQWRPVPIGRRPAGYFALVRSYTVTPPTVFAVKCAATQDVIAEEPVPPPKLLLPRPT